MIEAFEYYYKVTILNQVMLLLWIGYAFLTVILMALGAYMLLVPADRLVVRYQNWRLASSGLPLKDEDFANMPRFVAASKVLGGLLLLAGGMLLIAAFGA